MAISPKTETDRRIDASDLLEPYSHSTLAVIEDAGHALMHERPELFGSLLVDWLDRSRTGNN